MKAEVVVDLQFGSTGKGMVCADLALSRFYDASLRVQSIQAGHTVYVKGKPIKMRTIPCAFVNENVKLLLGPGCFIKKELLLDEIAMLKSIGIDVTDRLILDYRANYVLDEDTEAEERLHLSGLMGSTAEGAGASLIRKLWRNSKPTRVCDDNWAEDHGLKVADTVVLMNDYNMRVLVEGCQGTLLSVHTSPYYPHVTSRECTVAGIISEAGIAPRDVRIVHGVFRTFPIRVGGASGATGDSEMTWQQLAKESGYGLRLIPERTTVTNRVRRVFRLSLHDLEHAIRLNKPDFYYLTFINYVDSTDEGKTAWDDLTGKSQRFIYDIERALDIKIDWLSTSETTVIRRG